MQRLILLIVFVLLCYGLLYAAAAVEQTTVSRLVTEFAFIMQAWLKI